MKILHRVGLFCVLMCAVCCSVQAIWDVTVCSPLQPSASTPVPRPALSNKFEVHVECNMLDLNSSVEMHELYDFDDNIGAVRILQNGIEYNAYYSYKTNEIIFVDPKRKTCVVRDLSRSPDKFIFGYKKGTGHIFTAGGALHFTANQKYAGKGTARGIRCVTWYSCQYWAAMDATMNVTWYFSDSLNWDTSLGFKNIPVKAHIQGRVNKQTPHNFEHTYNLIHYRPFIKNMAKFETPSGVTCPGRKNTKPFPKLADAFSFSVEIVDNVRQQVSFMREWYDKNMNLVQFMYKPSRLSKSPYGHRPLKEIHDFSTGQRIPWHLMNQLWSTRRNGNTNCRCVDYINCGVAYIIDPMIGNCTVRSIERGSFDDTSVDPHHVRIRTSKEFFYTDAKFVTYEGVKRLRQMDSDVWVGRRVDFPPGLNSTWQWYFKTADWKASQDRLAEFSGGTPQMLTLSVATLPIDYNYNVYNFVRARPDIINFDISPCYQTANRRKFDFTIPGQFKNMVDRNNKLFKYSALLSLVGFCALTPLRIAKLKIVYGKDIHIRFEMLDKPPIQGDVYTNTTETTLDLAAAFFIQAVNHNKFVIMVDYDKHSSTQYIRATPFSIREYQYENELEQSTGYSPGALGGLLTGMAVAGGGMGAVLSFLFFK